jgi:hypothetical protein
LRKPHRGAAAAPAGTPDSGKHAHEGSLRGLTISLPPAPTGVRRPLSGGVLASV